MTAGDIVNGVAGLGFFLYFMLVIAFAGVYFLPTLIAYSRTAAVRGTVTVLNLFLGWTVIGWVVSLAMAFGPTEQKARAGTH